MLVVAGALADKTELWSLEARPCKYGSSNASVSFQTPSLKISVNKGEDNQREQ